VIPEIRGLDTEAGDPKYARIEFERRWLVDPARRPALVGCPSTLIEDRYIDGTRMRLRRMSRPDPDKSGWGEVKWKLTKKYETARPEARPIVTAYLTEAEYALLSALPAQPMRKTRHHLRLDDHWWSLDVFEGELAGLEIVEAEAADEAALAALVPPPWAAKEVTHDARYPCGALARSNAIPEVRWPAS
jgi:CYTH domain-containing protein